MPQPIIIPKLRERQQFYLVDAGAPKERVGYRSFELKPRLHDILLPTGKVLTPTFQLNKMRQYIVDDEPLDGYTILSGRENDQIATKLALYLAAQQEKRLKWMRIRGGYDYSFIDDLKQSYDPPEFLVVTGLYVNSTVAVLEKARDVIEELSLPTIIVTVGCDPVTFLNQHLLISASRMMYFSRPETPVYNPKQVFQL